METKSSYYVGEDAMEQKNYDILSLAAATYQQPLDKNYCKKISQIEFKYALKELGLSRYKIKVIIDTFIDLDFIRAENDYYIVNPVKTPFVKLLNTTVAYCLTHLGAVDFKIYCYLMHKYQKHLAGNYVENYFFSEKELIKMMGYGVNGASYEKIKQALHTLEDVGLISYNHYSVTRSPSRGLYKELYNVKEVSHPQIKSSEEMQQGDYEIDNYDLPGWEGMKKI